MHQKEYYDYIFSLHPKRIIFNPEQKMKSLLKWLTKGIVVTGSMHTGVVKHWPF